MKRSSPGCPVRIIGVFVPAIALIAFVSAASTAVAGTTYFWNPTALTAAAGNWDNTTASGWNSGAGLYPGSGGDLTLGAVENDVADANTKAYTGSAANSFIHMNGVNAFLSEFDWGSTATGSTSPFWTIDGLGATPGGSITFKALSGTATINSSFSRSGRQVYIQVPVAFVSNTTVNLTPVVGATDYFGINGAVTGAGNLTINTPSTSGGGVFFFDGNISGYTGTLTFDSTGTVSSVGQDRIGLIPAVANAHQMSVVLNGPTNLGQVGIFNIELGALNGTGGFIHPYGGGAATATLRVGYKNNANDSFDGVIADGSSFEKAGTGIQTLGANNTYTGNTTVSGGTLKLSSTGLISGSSSFDVRSGATFDVSAVGGGFTLPSSAMLKGAGTVKGSIFAGGLNTFSPGDSGAGTLSFNSGNLTIGGSTLNLDLSNSVGGANDKIAGVTALSLNGNITLNFNAPNGLGVGSYHLIDSSSLSGSPTFSYTGLSAGTTRQSFAISTTTIANTLTLDVTGSLANLIWRGNNGNNWDVNTTVNWTGAADNHFFTGDNVTFDDTATTFTPNVAVNVAPLNMTFSNTTLHTYTLGGPGAINASAAMNFTSTGTVQFNNTNSISAANLTNSGIGSAKFANSGSVIISGNVANSSTGTVELGNAGTVSVSGNLTNSGTVKLLVAAGNLTVGGSVTNSGASTFQLANTGNASITGNLTNGAGQVTIQNSGDFGITGNLVQSASGTTTIQNSGTFQGIGGTTTLNGRLNVNVNHFLTLSSATSGSGELHKQGINTVVLSGNNSGFTGNIVVENGILQAGSATALGTNAVTTVMNGAALDVNGRNMVNAIVTAEGLGTDGTGGLINTGSGFHHIYGLNLSNDLTIGTSGTAIFAIDGVNHDAGFSPPGAFLHGAGKNLTVNIGTGAPNGGELDLYGLGDTNLNNITVGGGGTLFVIDNTTLGPNTGKVTLMENGRIGFIAMTATTTKPIVVDASASVAEISNYASNNTINSPITIQGSAVLEANIRPSSVDTLLTMTLAGKITGTGSLAVHDVTNNPIRVGVVALTSNDNDYQGTTTIGGGGGLYGLTADFERAILSVGNGGPTGKLGQGDVMIGTQAELRFNRSTPITVGNNIFGDGNVTVVNANGKVTLTGANTYTGTTKISGGTLLVNGMHIGGGEYTVSGPTGGDYNQDGNVDAADYVLWRKDPNSFGGDPAGYDTWRQNFGAASGVLGGTGMITAGVQVNTGATLAPGNLGSGTFTVDYAIINGKLRVGYDGNLDTISKLVTTEGLDITNATVDFDNLTAGVLNGGPHIFAEYGSLSGAAFASILDLPAGYHIEYNYLNANQIALVSPGSGLGSGAGVPEPTAGVLLLCAVFGFVSGRGRRASRRSE